MIGEWVGNLFLGKKNPTRMKKWRREVLTATIIFLCWINWLIFGNSLSILVLGLCAGLLAFLQPAHALVLLALVIPFENQADLSYFGTVHTGELILVMVLPGLFLNSLKNKAWHHAALPIAVWVLPFVLITIAATVNALSPESIRGSLKLLEMMVVLVMGVHVLRRGQDAERVLWALGIGAILSAGMGFIETTQGPIVHPELLTIMVGQNEVVRARAGFGPNTLAVFIAMLLPFVFATAIFHPKNYIRFIGLVGSSVMVAGFVTTFSMTGIIALVVAIIIVGIGLAIHSPRWCISIVTLLATGFSLLILKSPELVFGAFWKTKLLSFADRLDYLQVTGKIVSEHFWLGIGPGMYRFVAPLVGGSDINPIGLITHPHSFWLTMMAEVGFLGLAILLVLLMRLAVFLIKKVVKLESSWPVAAGWALLAGLAGFFAANFTEHCLVHDRGVHAMLFLAATIVFVHRPPKLGFPEKRKVFESAWERETPDELLSDLQKRPEARKPLYCFLKEALQQHPRAKILEMGSGPARDALNLAENNQLSITVLDASTEALARARLDAQRLKRKVKCVQADVRHTGIKAESFDIIFSQGLLEHFPDPTLVLQEKKRLLKNTGRLIIDVPQTWHPYTLIKRWHFLKGDWPWGWETQYSLGDLKSLAAQFGMRVVSASGYGYRKGKWDWTYALRSLVKPIAPSVWDWLEQKTGAYWMMNIVVMLEKKPKPRSTSL